MRSSSSLSDDRLSTGFRIRDHRHQDHDYLHLDARHIGSVRSLSRDINCVSRFREGHWWLLRIPPSHCKFALGFSKSQRIVIGTALRHSSYTPPVVNASTHPQYFRSSRTAQIEGEAFAFALQYHHYHHVRRWPLEPRVHPVIPPSVPTQLPRPLSQQHGASDPVILDSGTLQSGAITQHHLLAAAGSVAVYEGTPRVYRRGE